MNQHPDKVIPAVYGGILMALLSATPFLSLINCFCCAGIILGGIAAVFFYKHAFTPDTPPYTSTDCVLVGALSGVVGAVLGTLLSAIFLLAFGDVMKEFLREVLLNGNLDIPSESRDQLERLFVEERLTPLILVVKFFSSLGIDVIFGLVGGLIGYAIWKPQVPPMAPMQRPE